MKNEMAEEQEYLYCRKTYLQLSVVLQFDDSCYVDAKQYHLASFTTRNSALNTSLRKAIRMQDFIQLCDSKLNWSSPASRHPPPGIRRPAPGTQHPAPGTRHPAPGTRHPAPGTRHPWKRPPGETQLTFSIIIVCFK